MFCSGEKSPPSRADRLTTTAMHSSTFLSAFSFVSFIVSSFAQFFPLRQLPFSIGCILFWSRGLLPSKGSE